MSILLQSFSHNEFFIVFLHFVAYFILHILQFFHLIIIYLFWACRILLSSSNFHTIVGFLCKFGQHLFKNYTYYVAFYLSFYLN
jgi:hypothetical protein